MLSAAAQAKIDAAVRGLLRADNPLLADLPSWVEWGRVASQAPVIREIVDAFTDVDVVVLDAPTGSGKTLIAELVRRLMEVPQTVYTCSTIALQDQFCRDFPYADKLMGRSNYPTLRKGQSEDLGAWDVTCADCTFTQAKVVAQFDDAGEWIGDKTTHPCDWCGDKQACPYERAKDAAVGSQLAVLNTRYLLTEGNGPGRMAGRGLVIADECDTLESELMGYVSVDIPQGRAKVLGIKAPPKVTVPGSWGPWFTYACDRVEAAIGKLPRFALANVKERRSRKSLTELLTRLRDVEAEYETGWVFTGDARKDEWGTISFKPVKVDKVAGEKLWKLGDKWLLMSATPISSFQMVRDDLGWQGEFRTVTMPSQFPVENRPIVVRPVGNMSRKTQVEDRGKLLAALDGVILDHSHENVLVHTVSYQLAIWLADELKMLTETPIWWYSSSAEKVSVVEHFKSCGGILIAPSLDRGVDLPDDLCSVIVVAKVPFPNLGDRQVSARMHGPGGQTWYNVQAVRSIVQMTGRGVRHKEDRAVTYILDSQFDRLWNSARGMFPKWWVDALEWRR